MLDIQRQALIIVIIILTKFLIALESNCWGAKSNSVLTCNQIVLWNMLWSKVIFLIKKNPFLTSAPWSKWLVFIVERLPSGPIIVSLGNFHYFNIPTIYCGIFFNNNFLFYFILFRSYYVHQIKFAEMEWIPCQIGCI